MWTEYEKYQANMGVMLLITKQLNQNKHVDGDSYTENDQ